MIFRKATLLIAALLVSISGASAAEPSKLPDWVLADHLDQIQRLNWQLYALKSVSPTIPFWNQNTVKEFRTYYEANVVPTAFHPSAVILPGDQDAAQVLWRRTRTLLDELKTLAPKEPGSFSCPDVSYDGKQILFSWGVGWSGYGGNTRTYFAEGKSSCRRENCRRIFALDLDSSAPDRLRMLTDVSGNDNHPIYLPNGRLVFVSDRRGGIARCGGPPRAPVLHSMNPDGSDQVPLSFHETNEWSPTVDNDGRIIYTRWDYIDRVDNAIHHLWSCYPDGRDPRAVTGNYPERGKLSPNAEYEFQPVPGDHRMIGVAGAHHFLALSGSLIVVDPNQPDDDSMSRVRRFTPETFFPATGESKYGYNNPSRRPPNDCSISKHLMPRDGPCRPCVPARICNQARRSPARVATNQNIRRHRSVRKCPWRCANQSVNSKSVRPAVIPSSTPPSFRQCSTANASSATPKSAWRLRPAARNCRPISRPRLRR
ncbi:MAG: hypothetical protein ABR915_03395 [Thermoguttaceae bacterium]|jgi:hypothetical protein